MGPIISIFRNVNSESPNMEMHYSYLYFRYQNRELLKQDFCSKISIYRDRVKNRALLKMLLVSSAHLMGGPKRLRAKILKMLKFKKYVHIMNIYFI